MYRTGHYLYIEASSPAQAGYQALLISKKFDSIPQCMTFWYSMFGIAMGTLNVYLEDASNNQRQLLWGKTGDQGNEWHEQKATLFSTEGYKVTKSMALESIALRPWWGKEELVTSGM